MESEADLRAKLAALRAARTAPETNGANLPAPSHAGDGPRAAEGLTARDSGGILDFAAKFRYRNVETGRVEMLRSVWPGQSALWEKLASEDGKRIGALKGRRVGLTLASLVWLCWRATLEPNFRGHLLSRSQDEAWELLEACRFALSGLPDAPVFTKENADELQWGTEDDLRTIKAYPTTKASTRSTAASLVLVDEWSLMDPVPGSAKVFQAVEPTSERIIMLWTPDAANSPTSAWFRKVLRGETTFKPVFVPADARPDRDQKRPEGRAFWKKVNADLTAEERNREYPLDVESALASGSNTLITMKQRDDATILRAHLPQPRFILGVDLARSEKGDATAYAVLARQDYPDDESDVYLMEEVLLRGQPFPVQRAVLLDLRERYGNPVVVYESTGIGQGFADEFPHSESWLLPFSTTETSKLRAATKLRLAFERGAFHYVPEDVPNFHRDIALAPAPGTKGRTEDVVMAVMFALSAIDEYAGRTTVKKLGKVHRPIFIDNAFSGPTQLRKDEALERWKRQLGAGLLT